MKDFLRWAAAVDVTVVEEEGEEVMEEEDMVMKNQSMKNQSIFQDHQDHLVHLVTKEKQALLVILEQSEHLDIRVKMEVLVQKVIKDLPDMMVFPESQALPEAQVLIINYRISIFKNEQRHISST